MAIAPTFVGATRNSQLSQVPGSGRDFAVIGTVGASDTYIQATGIVITAAQVGLTKIHSMNPVLFSTGHWGFWDGTKIKVFSAAATELADTSTALQSATFLLSGQGV